MLYCTEGRSLSSLLRETAATEAFTASYSQFPRPEHPVTPHEHSLGTWVASQNTYIFNDFKMNFQDLTFVPLLILK